MRGDDERWIELSTYPVASPDRSHRADRRPETIVLLRDVTESRMRQAVRDTFLGVLSHELRTPVTTIYAGSKVLARGVSGLDEEVRRSVFEDIHVEAERLHRLVEDVIAMTRFGEQDGEIGNEPVLLQRLLPGVVRTEETRWPGVTFDLRLPPGVPTVGADPTYVEQVIRNLLSNAAKYGGAGSRVETIVEALDDRSPSPDPRRRSGFPGRGGRPAVRAVLPLTVDRGDRQRGGDRAVRLRPAHPGDGRADVGTPAPHSRRRVRVQPPDHERGPDLGNRQIQWRIRANTSRPTAKIAIPPITK